MRSYRVALAGVPASIERIAASSPREAALAFFRTHPQGNTILVATNIFNEQTFRPGDFASEFPQLRTDALPIALAVARRYDPSKDPLVIACRATFLVVSLALGGLAARFIFRDREIAPGVVLCLCAAMSLGCGVVPSSRTLRRWLARDPQSLDAR